MTKKKGVSVFLFAAAAVLAAAAVRFFLYVTAIDFTSGFYTAEGGTAAGFFRLLLLILALLFFVLCLIGERRWSAFCVSSDGLGARVTLFLGGVYLAAAAVTVLGLIRAEGFSVSSAVETAGFAAVGLLLMKNTAVPPVAGGIQIGLSLCLFFRALTLFNGDLVIRNHSDPMLRLLAYVFGSLFFAAAARCYARLEMKHSRLREVFLGGLTFLFSGTYTLGKLAALLFGGNRVLGMEPFDPAAASLFLISGGFLAALCFTDAHKTIVYLSSGEKKQAKKKSESAALPQEEEEREDHEEQMD